RRARWRTPATPAGPGSRVAVSAGSRETARHARLASRSAPRTAPRRSSAEIPSTPRRAGRDAAARSRSRQRPAQEDPADRGLVAELGVQAARGDVALVVPGAQLLVAVRLGPGDLRRLQRPGHAATSPGAPDRGQVVVGAGR